MTLSELDEALNAMASKPEGDPQQMSGLITFHTDDWVPMPRFAFLKNMEDGMRYRDIRRVSRRRLSTLGSAPQLPFRGRSAA